MKFFDSSSLFSMTLITSIGAIVLSLLLLLCEIATDPLAIAYGCALCLLSIRFYESLFEYAALQRGTPSNVIVLGTATLIMFLSFMLWLMDADQVRVLSGTAGILVILPTSLLLRPK